MSFLYTVLFRFTIDVEKLGNLTSNLIVSINWCQKRANTFWGMDFFVIGVSNTK